MDELSKQAVDGAKKLRKDWELGNRCASDLFDSAGSHDVLVFRLILDNGLSGAFIRSRKHDMQVVVVNTSKPVYHQRFTLAHELGHLRLHGDKDGLAESVDETSADPAERQANVFAAELLVPFRELKSLLGSFGTSARDVSNRLVIELAKLFGVSHQAILWRLKSLAGDRITADETRARIQDTNWAAEWQEHAPDTYRAVIQEVLSEECQTKRLSPTTARQLARLPRAYKEMAFEAYRRRLITIAKLANVLGLDDVEVVREEIVPLIAPDQADRDQEVLRALQKLRDS